MVTNTDKANWDTLYETAAGQEGHFTTAQAAAAGISPQLLSHHLGSCRIRRIRRGVYRWVQFPLGDNEDLVVAWLWTNRDGVASLETALALHGLSDLMPKRIHLTLPDSWRNRRLRVPKNVSVEFGDIDDVDRQWLGSVPVTSPGRTILDCIEAGVGPEFVQEAIEQALDRGLIGSKLAASLRRRLKKVAK